MYVKYNYYIVDRLGYYYAGHKNRFADYTKNIEEASHFWNYDVAEEICKSLGNSFRVIGIER